MKRCLIPVVSLLLTLTSAMAHGTLIERLSGQVYYDTTLDITWLADANYAKTSGYDSDGRMDWYRAIAWAESLTIGGFVDWRLPTVRPITGGDLFNSLHLRFSNNASTNRGFATTGTGWRTLDGEYVSELGFMYYVNLANLGYCTPNGDGSSDSCLPQPGFGLEHFGPFSNLQNDPYWSGNPRSSIVWLLEFNTGNQLHGVDIGKDRYAWAVRDGDVSSGFTVPEPSTLILTASALLALGSWRGRMVN